MSIFKRRPPPLWTYPLLAALMLLFGGYLFKTWRTYYGAKGAPVAVVLADVRYHSKGADEVIVSYNGRRYRLPVTQRVLAGLRNGDNGLLYYDAHRDLVFDPRSGITGYFIGALVWLFASAAMLYDFFCILHRRRVDAYRTRRFYG